MRVKRPRRHVSAAYRAGRVQPGCANDSQSMDFVPDSLFNNSLLWALTLVDNFTRESLAIAVDQGIEGGQVVEVLDWIVAERSAPKSIRVDNGPEFVSKALNRWVYEHGVTLNFSRPGKPTDSAYTGSFNGSLRNECLNVNWFLSLEEARGKIEA